MIRLLRSAPGALLGVVGFLVGSLVLTLMVAGTLGQGSSGDTRTLHAMFTDVSGLQVGDDVRIAGVRVGRVSDTQLRGRTARVSLEVESGHEITEATRAEVAYLNLMGQRYVALRPGRGTEPAAPVDDEATIPVERTSGGLDLTALFNAFEPLFETIEPGQVNEFAGHLVSVLQGEGATYRSLVRRTARLTRTVSDRDRLIGRVLENVTLVLETTDDHRAEIKDLIGELGTLTHGLAGDRKAIGNTMDSVQALTERTASLVAETSGSIDRDVRALAVQSRFLARNRALLGDGVAALPRQLDVYLRTLGYGSYLNTYICRFYVQLPGTPKIQVGAGNQHSERCR